MGCQVAKADRAAVGVEGFVGVALEWWKEVECGESDWAIHFEEYLAGFGRQRQVMRLQGRLAMEMGLGGVEQGGEEEWAIALVLLLLAH